MREPANDAETVNMNPDYFLSSSDTYPSQWLPKGIVDGEDDSSTLISYAMPSQAGNSKGLARGGVGGPQMQLDNSKVVGSVLYDVEGLLPTVSQSTVVEPSTSPKSTTHLGGEPSDNFAGGSKMRGPSGPRLAGQGVEEEKQQVASIEIMPNGGLRLRVTLLAAGFVIGASGASIREIMRHTGSTIQSWTQQPEEGVYHRPCRVFCIQGNPESVLAASNIIHEAVERYKELCEGKRRGEFVQRLQYIHGVEFSYQPPPKNVVPNAASVNGVGTGFARQGGSNPLLSRQTGNGKPMNDTMRYMAALQAQQHALQREQSAMQQAYAAGLAAGAKMSHVHSFNFGNAQLAHNAPPNSRASMSSRKFFGSASAATQNQLFD